MADREGASDQRRMATIAAFTIRWIAAIFALGTCAMIIQGALIIVKIKSENMNLWYHNIDLVISQIQGALIPI